MWDTYLPDSLKESTWEKRCKGVCRKVYGLTTLSCNAMWPKQQKKYCLLSVHLQQSLRAKSMGNHVMVQR